MYCISPISSVLYKREVPVHIKFLTLYLRRSEFYRYVDYDNFASQRAEYNLRKLGELLIPLPSPAEQQKAVNVWRAFREIKVQNEAKAAPLMQLCQSYIQELKHKYPMQEIGPYIHRIDERNTDNKIKEVRSVSVTKNFNVTNAKVDKNNLSNYKIVRENQISFVQTTGNEKCLCAAINHLGFPIVVTSVNEVFETDEKYLLADYLHLIFRRTETDRYARFNSWGSARETFTWEDMTRFAIPLPSIEVQQAIVNIYKCANEAKRIAEEADRLSREVCPALLQHIIHS
ncbi:restriction endonuclease subunit S [uncultured Alistipes sp.]|uniref:restriction endonuclease subunit S n=1 Tax=uncultured Alistipes sp. TaxID=538949 RepID=UPI002621A657|nr:restriction endonuclease subunit S [uncultured Alistipes sp.]